MSLNIFSFFIFYKLILFSVIGFGYFFSNLFFKKAINDNLGFVGLLGLFFLLIYSYYSHILIPHTYFHNVIILAIGLGSFVFVFRVALTYLQILSQSGVRGNFFEPPGVLWGVVSWCPGLKSAIFFC